MTSKVSYLGDLRTSSIHIQSGTEIISDAPVDNKGKGEAFSPTDLVANALASCMITIMGIKAADLAIDMKGTVAEVTKVMNADPRRIGSIKIDFSLVGTSDQKQRTLLERAAMTCPVFLSLHPEIEKDITFSWN
ncbi:OsmC family protein [Flavobacterium sp. 14A]|uniref:OsmC family protein n=1 Tax=Flavobacterium sp. 14A TaxID=2735896 RepID=UPI00156E40FE|nr:OsmC family protein [Flavobacterium sp. 14A]NRT11243.1 putative OsmC-like protein [Flavobacterium sp. 14A]